MRILIPSKIYTNLNSPLVLEDYQPLHIQKPAHTCLYSLLWLHRVKRTPDPQTLCTQPPPPAGNHFFTKLQRKMILPVPWESQVVSTCR